jgi:hypothetical protein
MVYKINVNFGVILQNKVVPFNPTSMGPFG